MGFAVTRPAARRLVSHRGITVNGAPVNLPSYQVKAGDAIALSERAQKQLRVKEALTVSSTMDLSPSWVEVDSNKFSGVFKAVPERGDLPADINDDRKSNRMNSRHKYASTMQSIARTKNNK